MHRIAVPVVGIGQNVAEISGFFYFSRRRLPPCWIFKFQTFNGRTAQEGRNASPCQIWSKSVKNAAQIWRFLDFCKMAAVRHLGFVMCVFGPPTKGVWWSYRCAKFGCNRCSSFDNMHVFRFHEFGLKTPIHAHKMGVWGNLTP